MICEFAKGSEASGYVCKLTKRKCPHQGYCNITHRYNISKADSCLVRKNKNERDKQKNGAK